MIAPPAHGALGAHPALKTPLAPHHMAALRQLLSPMKPELPADVKAVLIEAGLAKMGLGGFMLTDAGMAQAMLGGG